MRLFITIIAFIFLASFTTGCATMSNHNDLKISVDNQDCEGPTQPESPKPESRPLPQRAKAPQLWKWPDTVKKR